MIYTRFEFDQSVTKQEANAIFFNILKKTQILLKKSNFKVEFNWTN
jgi:hypothetical protein